MMIEIGPNLAETIHIGGIFLAIVATVYFTVRNM